MLNSYENEPKERVICPLSNDLGDLVDSQKYREALVLGSQDMQILTMQLEKMILIRIVEQVIADLVRTQKVKCPCHLAVGQEAVAVGVAQSLTKKDRAFGNHRSHAHYLAMGGSVEELFAEVFGKETGCSKGMGGSMHLYAGQVGFHGSVPIVAGTVPVAVGAALSAKLSGSQDVGVAFFGDGACEEGVVHEALNFSSVMKLPMIFVVENNLYSSHMDINLRQPSDSVARFAVANRMNYDIVDGNDVLAVDKAASSLISKARVGEGPAFLEAVTYRWLGHVGGNDDIDVGVRRSSKELEGWKQRDPIERTLKALESKGAYSRDRLKAYEATVHDMVSVAIEKAQEAAWPKSEKIYEYVYHVR